MIASHSLNALEFTMPKSVNKVILVGNVGNDPEVKYTPSGIPVGKFSLATNERFKDKNGEFQERTEWHNIVVWQRLAEIVGEFVSKGSKVYVEGKLQTTSWEDRQSGERKYRTQVVARDLVLLDSRRNVKTARRQPIMLQMKVRRRPPHPAKLWKTSPSGASLTHDSSQRQVADRRTDRTRINPPGTPLTFPWSVSDLQFGRCSEEFPKNR